MKICTHCGATAFYLDVRQHSTVTFFGPEEGDYQVESVDDNPYWPDDVEAICVNCGHTAPLSSMNGEKA